MVADVRPDDLGAALEDDDIDAVILDAGDALGDALRLSNASRADRPDVPIVLVGTGAAERTPEGVVVYDKWEQMDEAIAALEARLRGDGA